MSITIDAREQELFKTCKYYLEISPLYKDLKLNTASLPIGDILISDNDVDESIIIERKSLRDLSASIKDGRYEEQSYRLNGSMYHNHNVIYLIEGDMNRPNAFREKLDKTTLYSAMVSLHYFKGFSVLRSMSIDESAIIICNMAYKVKKGKMENKSPFYRNGLVQTKEVIADAGLADAAIADAAIADAGLADTAIADAAIANAAIANAEIAKVALTKEALAIDNNNETENLEKDYCFVVKKVKKDNITPNNIGEILLSQIPGISSVSALAIMSTFKTLPNLIMRIKEDVACLHGVTYTNSKNQTRKLNKTIIANIIKFLRPE